jgi:low temperature requirement protein LtrA
VTTLLRDRSSPAEGRVTFVELFFDLVFVFAVTQLAHHLAAHLTVKDALDAGVLLLAVWSVWVYTTWATNWLNTNHPLVRLMFFALMAAGLVLSTSLPQAMGERALPFAIAIALMQNGRNAFTIWCLGQRDVRSRRNFTRIQIWLGVAGVLWILGAFAHDAARFALWTGAILVELGSPWWRYWTPWLGFSPIEDWQVSPQHFAERCGLFIIIALGESVLVTGATFAELEWTPTAIAAFAVAFAGTIAVWWVYYATTAEQATEEFEHAERTGPLARAGYTYTHIPIVAGIILMAVGDEVLLAHPTGHATPATIALLVGGPAFFLVGSALFNRLFCGEYPRSHALGVLGLVGVALLGTVASPLVVAAAAVLVLVLVAGWETGTDRVG